ncbi:MAG TPA: 2-phosphosulfolactate phosphatase, partial [Flavobacteriales bacterium]|nr:2-phosphosulfolactate phosphatase [Flavobacteriales bacterium]
PGEYHLYQEEFDLVVVLDVLRATSAICTAIEHGVKEIIPVATLDEARAYQAEGYLVAAERGGQIVEGFDLGNSPFSYMDPALKGQTVVLTTTNGTKAINMARNKKTVVIGSLNNLDALCEWLIRQQRDVLVLGSGWKDKFNLEDTICAGAIADQCLKSGRFFADEDSTVAAKFIFRSSRDNMFAFLKASSHRRRLRKLNLNEDVKHCLTPNNCTAIPVLEGRSLVRLNHERVPSSLSV